MPLNEARRRLRGLDGDTSYHDVIEYIEDLAALCIVYPDEVAKRISKKSGYLYLAFWRATDPKR